MPTPTLSLATSLLCGISSKNDAPNLIGRALAAELSPKDCWWPGPLRVILPVLLVL